MPLRPCNEVGCDELVPRGRCRKHQRAHARRQVEHYRWVYAQERWLRTRKLALVRAGGRCQAVEGGIRCEVRSGLQGHHNYPGGVRQLIEDGADPFDVRYVVMLCDEHHRRAEQRLRRGHRR